MSDAGVLDNVVWRLAWICGVWVEGYWLQAIASVLLGSHLLPPFWVPVENGAQAPKAAVGPTDPVKQGLRLRCVQRTDVVCAVVPTFLTVPESGETHFTWLRKNENKMT